MVQVVPHFCLSDVAVSVNGESARSEWELSVRKELLDGVLAADKALNESVYVTELLHDILAADVEEEHILK